MSNGWRTTAACIGLDPDMFFPGFSDVRGRNAAKQVCAACPVRPDCLAEALTEEGGRPRNHRFGVRGEKTPGQRHALFLAARGRAQRAAA